jgi:chloramphenicol 3-O-phosphotransferase
VNDAAAVVVVSGPPGAGKTTVARLLAEAVTPSVHLHTDDFWAFIRQGLIPPYLPEAQNQNDVVMTVVATAAFGYAAGGYYVVVDGVIGPWYIDAFRGVASAAPDIPLHYVILRPDRDTTLGRALDRGPGALTEREPVLHMHGQFQGLGQYEAYAVDSSVITPRVTVDIVQAGLVAGSYLLSDARTG